MADMFQQKIEPVTKAISNKKQNFALKEAYF